VAAAAAESLLDALAPGSTGETAPRQGAQQRPNKMYGVDGGVHYGGGGKQSMWLMADSRPAGETPAGLMGPEKFLGHWVDSQGNSVHVLSTDAFSVNLVATLSRPPRPDIHLAIKPVVLGGGWQCGHSLLDPVWTSEEQLHWVAMDGRVSVWVRPQETTGEEDAKGEANTNSGEDKADAAANGDTAPTKAEDAQAEGA